MKSRFSSIDILAIVSELQKLIGMRVNQVYDVDNKTYLIRLNRYEEKVVLLLESGIRMHTTEYEWPKNPSPSGFSMKFRKHIKNKRLESIKQLGTDRIVDFQFGINDAAYHIILELYDRGNIVLTDFEYTILNILRPRASGSEDVKFIVREKYPVDRARDNISGFDQEVICSLLTNAKQGENLKKVLMSQVAFGPALLDHVLVKNDFPKNCAINKQFKVPQDIPKLLLCLEEADQLMKSMAKICKGYVFHKIESNKDSKEIIANVEFHPYLFQQFSDLKHTVYDTFDKAVDNYFSSMEGQKIDLKALQKEKEAFKKLENVKKDHEQRLLKLHESQAEDIKKAQLIEMNLDLVDKAIMVIRSAIANQISWSHIQDLIKEAQLEGDPVASAIKKLKLDINHFTVLLANTHVDSEDENEESKPQLIDIDLDFSAYANARKYYDMKRAHAKKEQKTIESSEKAFKNAEKKTKQALKEVAVATSITKARKVMWFEKFLWFISSENYLVIAGRDVQQNELLVKKYLKANDLYVHADLHGASSVVLKNPEGGEVPPKTLNEAGIMAVCNSSAWDAKIVTSAWWVHANQVSKTAPSGEYLTTGSFMIRGKKNYLTPAYLIMGFGFMFKLDEESIQNHVSERSIKSEDHKQELNNQVESIQEEEPEVDSDDKSSTSSDETGKTLENQLSVESNAANSDEDKDEDGVTFPDTEVKINVLPEEAEENDNKEVKTNPDNLIIQHTKKAPLNIPKDNKNAVTEAQKNKQTALKRGQRSKLKKIKEKYKYQDEEERELRMKILGSAGPTKEPKKNKNKKGKEVKPQQQQQKNPKKVMNFIEVDAENTIVDVKPVVPEEEKNVVAQNDGSDDEEEETTSDEFKVLNTLTGCPILEDTMLYAVPVCAPYSSILNYKYKIKIIPGSSRRGKAAKTALQIFLQEKSATQREKDLLKSVKDQDISRNLPGKIKISSAGYKKK